MPRGGWRDGGLKQRAFNSLFEMRLQNHCGSAQGAEELSILYLRCSFWGASAPVVFCFVSFNSLFEMRSAATAYMVGRA